jgi:hypothetical protein
MSTKNGYILLFGSKFYFAVERREGPYTIYPALDDIYCIEPGYTTLNFH